MQYMYIAWQEEGQWTAHSPSVPGVYGVGSTRSDAVADLSEAVGEMSAYLHSIGERLPPSRKIATGLLEIRR